jgi:pyruvate dehydrogenase E2 component (dihydrolipoamide acetyltransferase)
MYGVSVFSAVINPPQGCILAVGAGHARVVPDEKNPDELKVINTVTVQLSADRRVVDEAIAAQFLQVSDSKDPLYVEADYFLRLGVQSLSQ